MCVPYDVPASEEYERRAVFCLHGKLFDTMPQLHAVVCAAGVFASFVAHDYVQEVLLNDWNPPSASLRLRLTRLAFNSHSCC